jgi:hypothetical protein
VFAIIICFKKYDVWTRNCKPIIHRTRYNFLYSFNSCHLQHSSGEGLNSKRKQNELILVYFYFQNLDNLKINQIIRSKLLILHLTDVFIVSWQSDATLSVKVTIDDNCRFFKHMSNGSTTERLSSPDLHFNFITNYESSTRVTSNKIRLASLESSYNLPTVFLVDVSFRNALRFVQMFNFAICPIVF